MREVIEYRAVGVDGDGNLVFGQWTTTSLYAAAELAAMHSPRRPAHRATRLERRTVTYGEPERVSEREGQGK